VRRAARQFDQRNPRSHTFDGKAQPPAEHLREVANVRRDVVAGSVEIVELLKRSRVHVSGEREVSRDLDAAP